MKGTLMLVIISSCIAASALAAQNQEGAPRSISPQQSAPPSQNPTPHPSPHEMPGLEMPGMEMPNQRNEPSQEKRQPPMPEADLLNEAAKRPPIDRKSTRLNSSHR